jgi:N utilization substance protein A
VLERWDVTLVPEKSDSATEPAEAGFCFARAIRRAREPTMVKVNRELMGMIDTLNRERDVDIEVLYDAIEAAMLTVAHRRYGTEPDLSIKVDRVSGSIICYDANGSELPLDDGRISAQIAKQVIIQRIREAERDVTFDDYINKVGDVISGTVQRFEGPHMVVNLGKAEALCEKREQVREEQYNVGDRIKAYISDVRKVGQKVKIFLSRTHPGLVKRLFEQEIPEVHEKVIEIKAVVREPGVRTKIAVTSFDPKVDCVGACVGVRGTRIKAIKEELNGEKIDIIRWNESPEVLIMNALKPATIHSITLEDDESRAKVVVPDDQLSIAIGRKGQNVRLASRLSQWEIDIVRESDEKRREYRTAQEFMMIPGVEKPMADALVQAGYDKLEELIADGVDALTEVVGFTKESAAEVLAYLDGKDYDAIRAEMPAMPTDQELGIITPVDLFDNNPDTESHAAGSQSASMDVLFPDSAREADADLSKRMAEAQARERARREGTLKDAFADQPEPTADPTKKDDE